MSKWTIDKHVWRDSSWWHWALTIPLLVVYLAGHRWGIIAAMGLCAVTGCYFWYRLRQVKPYPVQVRIAYPVWSALGLLPGMQWMLWIQLCGTTAMVTVGYCPLIRLLSILPPNRTEPLTASLMWRAFVKQPCAGGLVKWTTPTVSSAATCCMLPTDSGSLTCAVPYRQTAAREYQHAQTH
jgi:hypothetical protein